MDDAKQDYLEYSGALDKLSQTGGAEELPEYLGQFLTADGYARKLVLDELRALKGSGSKWHGGTIVKGFELIHSDLESDTPEVDWQVCVDQTDVKVQPRSGSSTPLDRRADRVEMHFNSEDGRWQIENIEYSAGPVPNLCAW